MARPKIEIDPLQVEKLAKIGATNAEIGDFFGCGESTIRGRFRDILTKARTEQKIRLRQLQWREAEKGNWKMMIWLGKQLLDQKEKADMTTNGGDVNAPQIIVETKCTADKIKRYAKK